MNTPTIEELWDRYLGGFQSDTFPDKGFKEFLTEVVVPLLAVRDRVIAATSDDESAAFSSLFVDRLYAERNKARSERDAALATVEHRNSELAVTRAENERLRTVTDSIHRDTLAQWAGTQAQLDAALAECKRLGDIATAALSNLDKTFARVISTKDELAAALAECERLRKERQEAYLLLMTRESEYAGLYPIDKMTDERDAWRACADQLAAVLNNDLSDFKGDAAKDIDWAASEALAVYEQLKGQP